MSIANWIAANAKKEYSAKTRIVATAFPGLIVVILIPTLLVYLSTLENSTLSENNGVALLVMGGFVAMGGISLGLWTVWVQFHEARGSPVPIMATKKLLTNKPYSFCRNPMLLGTILFYTGISIGARSYLAAGATVAFTICLIVWIAVFEEREMVLRFGEDYMCYVACPMAEI